MKKALPASGRPIAPSSMSLRQVWCDPPRKVSGAQPTRRPSLLGRVEERARLGGRGAERLFRVDVLAGCESLQAHLHVGGRDGEIDDDLDRRVREQLVDRHRPQPELGRARLGRLAPDVGDALDVKDRESDDAALR